MLKWKDAWPTYITSLPILVIVGALIGRAVAGL
jgi:hypothetical protein